MDSVNFCNLFAGATRGLPLVIYKFSSHFSIMSSSSLNTGNFELIQARFKHLYMNSDKASYMILLKLYDNGSYPPVICQVYVGSVCKIIMRELA